MGIVINHSENIFLPQMIITKPEMEEKVEAFVKNGGTVIVTYRHAVKDADNNVPFGETLPVHYNALAGLTVEETESLQDYDAFPVVGSGVFEGVEGTGGIFRDMIQVQDAEVLFHYADAFYLEFAAVTRKQTGRGTLYYVGCGLEEKITKLLMEQVMAPSWHFKTVKDVDSDEGSPLDARTLVIEGLKPLSSEKTKMIVCLLYTSDAADELITV